MTLRNPSSNANNPGLLRRCGEITALLAFILLTEQGTVHAEEEVLHYPVQVGDNPWNITERFLLGLEYWKPLLKLNGIDKPRQLRPGSRLTIPLSWLRSEPASAQVRAVSGVAHYTAAGTSTARPLRLDTELGPGDQITIGEPGSAILEYSDGSTLLLAKNTRLSLTQVNHFPGTGLADTKLRLDAGRTENRIPRRGSRFEIDTPSASTAVRGTRFRASVDNANTELSRVEVTTGNVAVQGSGAERGIAAGFGTLIEKGKPPLEPIRLLAPPTINMPTAYSRRFPVEIGWLPEAGARQYRLQIIAAGASVSLLDQVTDRTGLSTDALDDGSYSLILRAIDDNGLEGQEAIFEFELDAQPQPPLAIAPEIEQTVRSELPEFEWTRPGNNSRIRIQLARSTEPEAPLIDVEQIDASRFTPEKLAPGTYVWRLATQQGDEQGPWGHYRRFTLRPAPGEPQVSATGDAQQIKLHWADGGEGRRYRAQLGDSTEFDTVLAEQLLDEPAWQAGRPQMPSYFRVRIVDTDGYEGAWSRPQMIDPAPRPWYIYAAPLVLFLLTL